MKTMHSYGQNDETWNVLSHMHLFLRVIDVYLFIYLF